MPRTFGHAIIGVRDLSRCLIDSGRLKFPVSVGDLLDVVRKNIEAVTEHPFPIHVECRDWKGSEFRSVLLRYKDSATIVYSKSLNLCWRRFSVCKELAHLAFDTEGDFTTDYAALAPLLVADVPVPAGMEGPFGSEQTHFFVALEMLLPWELRGDIKKMRDAGKTDFEIAYSCKVPEQVVASALHSKYDGVSTYFNQQYDKKIGGDWAAEGLAGI